VSLKESDAWPAEVPSWFSFPKCVLNSKGFLFGTEMWSGVNCWIWRGFQELMDVGSVGLDGSHKMLMASKSWQQKSYESITPRI
jgi:hypothetical protein